MNGDIQESNQEKMLGEQLREKWKEQLPLRVWDGAKSQDELFAEFDRDAPTLKISETETFLGVLNNGETNNFHLIFSLKEAVKALSGEITFYGEVPFYINKRFNNLWNRMCDEFSIEIDLIADYEKKFENGEEGMPKDVRKALQSIALHLKAQSGGKIILAFICK